MGSENYALFRGEVKMGLWVGTTYPVALTSVGNVPEFTLELSEETLEHYSSMSGIRTKDKVITLQTDYSIGITCDEISAGNIARFLRGSYVAPTVSDDGYVDMLTALDSECAIEFLSANPAGPQIKLNLWRVKLKPAGELALITESDWAQLAFEGEGLKVDALGAADADPTSHYARMTMIGTATG